MLIFVNQRFNPNNVVVIALIGITIYIMGCCPLAVGSIRNAVEIDNNLNLIDATLALATTTNEYSNQVDNEVLAPIAPTPTPIAASNPIVAAEPYTLYLNVSQYPGDLCNRVCVQGVQRVCYFEFTLEHYQAMGV